MFQVQKGLQGEWPEVAGKFNEQICIYQNQNSLNFVDMRTYLFINIAVLESNLPLATLQPLQR